MPEGTDVVTCGLVGRALILGDVGVSIPRPGFGITASALTTLGGDGLDELSVAVASDGKLHYRSTENSEGNPGEVTGASSLEAAPGPCSDSAFTQPSSIQNGIWTWYIGDGARPGAATTATTVDAIVQVLGWLSTGYNDCGLSSGYPAAAVASAYQGTSTLESDMHEENGTTVCGDQSFDNHDGASVIDFENITQLTVLATTCTFFTVNPFGKDRITQADVRFDSTGDGDHKLYINLPQPCNIGVDFKAVAMHEFGHAYGLKHVDELAHKYLTMSESTLPCDTSQRTLGLGDLLAMREQYQ